MIGYKHEITVEGGRVVMSHEPPAKRTRLDEPMDVELHIPRQLMDNGSDYSPRTFDYVKLYPTTLVVGRTYYMYRRPAGQVYISLLSPKDWNDSPPHDFILAIRYEGDFAWTKVDETL